LLELLDGLDGIYRKQRPLSGLLLLALPAVPEDSCTGPEEDQTAPVGVLLRQLLAAEGHPVRPYGLHAEVAQTGQHQRQTHEGRADLWKKGTGRTNTDSRHGRHISHVVLGLDVEASFLVGGGDSGAASTLCHQLSLPSMLKAAHAGSRSSAPLITGDP